MPYILVYFDGGYPKLFCLAPPLIGFKVVFGGSGMTVGELNVFYEGFGGSCVG